MELWFQKDVKSISLSTPAKIYSRFPVFQKDVKSISLSTIKYMMIVATMFQKDVKSISLSTHYKNLSFLI